MVLLCRRSDGFGCADVVAGRRGAAAAAAPRPRPAGDDAARFWVACGSRARGVLLKLIVVGLLVCLFVCLFVDALLCCWGGGGGGERGRGGGGEREEEDERRERERERERERAD